MHNNDCTKIIAVAVEPQEHEGVLEKRTRELFIHTNTFLHSLDTSISLFDFPSEQFIVNSHFCGKGYGIWTPEDALIIKIFKNLEGLQLEGTYSTKAVSAFVDDVINKYITTETVLIWNTYCGLDFNLNLKGQSYTRLPIEFHVYFEQDVQLLDRLIN